MDIMELGAIGELVGGVAVLVTLVYLALQVRQNTSQVRLSTANAMIANLQNAMSPVYDHFDVYDNGLENATDLSQPERRMFSLMMLRILHAFQNSYYQQIEGALTSGWYNVHITGISTFTHRPGGALWWSENRDRFNDEFRDLVDTIASNPS